MDAVCKDAGPHPLRIMLHPGKPLKLVKGEREEADDLGKRSVDSGPHLHGLFIFRLQLRSN